MFLFNACWYILVHIEVPVVNEIAYDLVSVMG